MDFHHLLTFLSVDSMDDVTAFSALPNAPVLEDRPSRVARLRAAWRTRRAGSVQTPSLHRPAAAPALRSARVAPQPADSCRMVA
ncbi:MAG: hypothetical protein HY828_09755 [Actinobacteria bacterium]|nr:hypothetical protein [Actinomycetota bacterium]